MYGSHTSAIYILLHAATHTTHSRGLQPLVVVAVHLVVGEVRALTPQLVLLVGHAVMQQRHLTNNAASIMHLLAQSISVCEHDGMGDRPWYWRLSCSCMSAIAYYLHSPGAYMNIWRARWAMALVPGLLLHVSHATMQQ